MPDLEFNEYRALTRGSAEAHRRASTRVPGGVASNVRYFPPYPVHMARAAGSKVYDVDGREYTDYCLAFGPLITGHGHPRVLEAVKKELDRRGTVITAIADFFNDVRERDERNNTLRRVAD